MKGVTKSYPSRRHLRNMFQKSPSIARVPIVQDLNIELGDAEILCVVGPNGAGKSTLAKLIAGTSPPDKGIIQTFGRVVPFLELGAAFLSDLSAKDNVLLNGALLGLRRSYIKQNLESIFDFAELSGYENKPLKQYSSGMLMRLAFAIGMHTDGELYVFDEVLAVGDTRFQEKCLKSFQNLVETKKTLIIITHDMSVVRRYATQVLIISSGTHKLITDHNYIRDFDPEVIYRS